MVSAFFLWWFGLRCISVHVAGTGLLITSYFEGPEAINLPRRRDRCIQNDPARQDRYSEELLLFWWLFIIDMITMNIVIKEGSGLRARDVIMVGTRMLWENGWSLRGRIMVGTWMLCQSRWGLRGRYHGWDIYAPPKRMGCGWTLES